MFYSIASYLKDKEYVGSLVDLNAVIKGKAGDIRLNNGITNVYVYAIYKNISPYPERVDIVFDDCQNNNCTVYQCLAAESLLNKTSNCSLLDTFELKEGDKG